MSNRSSKLPQFMDQDYWSLLDEETKAYLNQFNDEYYKGYFNPEKDPIHSNPVETARESYSRQNAMRRDAFNYWNQEEDYQL